MTAILRAALRERVRNMEVAVAAVLQVARASRPLWRERLAPARGQDARATVRAPTSVLHTLQETFTAKGITK